MAKVVVKESEVEGVRRDPPRVSRLLLSEHTVGAKQISMGTNVTEPGSRIPLGKHTGQEEAMFCISGKGKFYCGGEVYDIEPGTAFFSPMGVEHELVNVGTEPLKIVWAYAPPLPEHLKQK